ncbi:hypothetical protein EPN44_10120 [bacterium]|nr:MAG: hypothetical protein EPN44_10120 [bacterium]
MSERTTIADGLATQARNQPRVATLTFVMVVAQLAITVPLAYVLNVWQDDAYTLASTAGSLRHAIHQAIFFEQNAPLYFALMVLWRAVSSSYFVARLFSVLCAAGVVYVLPKLLQRYLPDVQPAWIMLAVAFNPFLIWAALEIRLYALVILLSTLLLLTFYDAFLIRRPSRGHQLAYAALCIISAYTQYYLLALIVAQGLVLVLRRRWRALGTYVAIGVVAMLAFVPMLRVLPAQLANFRGSFVAPHTPLVPATTLAEILLQYVVPLTVIPHHKALYAALIIAALAGGFAARRYAGAKTNLLIGLMLAPAFVLFSLVIFAAGEHILNRHAASLFVPTVMTAFAALTIFREPARGRAVAAVGLLILASSAVTLVSTYRPMAKAGDWTRLTSYLEARERPGQPILVFEAENAVPLAYYYRGPNPIVAIPVAVDFRTYNVDRFVLHDGAQIAAQLARIPGDHRTLWLVTGQYCRALNIDFGCDTLERYVRDHYETLSAARFYGSELRELRRVTHQ